MTKEDILAKARKENKGADIVTMEAQTKANSIAGAATLLIGTALYLIESMRYDRELPEFWAVYFVYWAVSGFAKFLLLRKRGVQKQSWIWLLYGVVMLFMTVLALIKTFQQLKAGA